MLNINEKINKSQKEKKNEKLKQSKNKIENSMPQ